MQNREIIAEKKREYWRKNREYFLKKKAEHYQENIEAIRKKNREVYRENSTKFKARSKKNRKKFREKINARNRVYNRGHTQNLADSYIKSLIARYSRLPFAGIPQEIVDLKRNQIILHRALADAKKQINERG